MSTVGLVLSNDFFNIKTEYNNISPLYLRCIQLEPYKKRGKKKKRNRNEKYMIKNTKRKVYSSEK